MTWQELEVTDLFLMNLVDTNKDIFVDNITNLTRITKYSYLYIFQPSLSTFNLKRRVKIVVRYDLLSDYVPAMKYCP